MNTRSIHVGLLVLAVLTAGPLHARAQVVEYYHLDGIGNVRAVTDAAGAVVERHDYLPFGEECTTSPCAPVTVNQPRRFTGKERDTESSLDYFGARYYANRIGRFTGIDPATHAQATLVDPQRWNRYAYVSNRPLLLTDPDGREQPTVMNGKVVMGGVDGESAGSEHAKNVMLGVLGGAALGGTAVALAPEILTAATIFGSNPENQALVVETLEGAAGGAPGATSGLRFGQRGVSAVFRHGEFAGMSIDDVAAGLRTGVVRAEQLPVQFVERGGIKYAINNRSLLALKRAGMDPTIVRDVTGDARYEAQLTARLGEMKGAAEAAFEPKVRKP